MKRQAFLGNLLAALLLLSCAAFAQKTASPPQIPAGITVQVRIIENLTSEKAQPGDAFHGTLEEPIVVDGREVYPKGADVSGRVMATHSSGRLSDPGILSLELNQISYRGRTTTVHSEPFTIKGESHTKSNVTKIGGGAAIGTVIGAIAGGGKGAAIGAGVGAAAGTGVAAATGKKEASVESEAVLSFTIASADATTATPASRVSPAGERTYDETSSASDANRFSLRDQRVVRTCFEQNAASLPPGLAKRTQLPPGQERQLARGQTLPPGLQKRLQPLPEVCERQLYPLPPDMERVVYNRRVLLLDANSRILDAFDIDTE